MRLLLLKHFEFDDASVFLTWSLAKQYDVEILYVPDAYNYPELSTFDCLIILGGPMSVYQEQDYPWLRTEKLFVRSAVDHGKLILGVCLGAQMLAEILGGNVYRNAHKEIGWHLVRCIGTQHPLLDGIPDTFYSFQWHGDCVDPPEGASILAYSDACSVQAFAYGLRVLGLQFHLETTPACIETMLDLWTSDLAPGPYVQSAEHIRQVADRSENSAGLLTQILERYEQLFAAGG